MRISTIVIAPVVLFVSLATIATVTTAVQFRSRSLRREIAKVEPAREQVRNVELAVALQMSALHGFALTHDHEFLRSFERSRTEEERSLRALSQMAPRFKNDVAGRMARLQELSHRWHDAVPRVDFPTSGERRPEPLAPAEFEQAIYADVIAEATAIQEMLARVATDRERRIDAAERLDWRATLLFTFLALVTGLFILGLSHRVRRLAFESERRRQELERLMESRARLMRGLSHDIRNPLGAVLGYTELLEEGLAGPLVSRQYEMVKRMHRAIGSALSILDDVLLLSQAEAGTLSIQKKNVDAVPLLEEAVADHKQQADQAGLMLKARLPAQPVAVTTDAERVRQILGNLLSNAIKYTPPPGEVLLSASVRKADSAPGAGPWLALEVRDSGPGIPADLREKIFEEFYRIDDGGRHVKGFGVGLAMSRRIARLLGGEVTIESGLAEGAAFTLWLPIADASSTTVPPAAE